MRRRPPEPPTPIELPKGIKIACDIYRLWSHKAGDRVVTLYGSLELDHALLLEASPEVVCWREQPLQLRKVRADGSDYVLDYWKYLVDDTEIIGEVKEDKLLVDAPDGRRVPKDWLAAEPEIREWGARPEFVTEHAVNQHQYLIGNWREAVGHIARAYYYDDQPTRQKICDLVEQRAPITLGELEGYLSSTDPNDVWAQALRLIQDVKITANLDAEPLDRCLKLRRVVN